MLYWPIKGRVAGEALCVKVNTLLLAGYLGCLPYPLRTHAKFPAKPSLAISH